MSFSPCVVERDADFSAQVFSDGLSSRLAHRTGPVPTSGTLRTRTRHDESLRPALQSPVLQRRLSRRAPRPTGRTLDPIVPAQAERSTNKTVAGSTALAGIFQPRPFGAAGFALDNAAPVRPQTTRPRLSRICATPRDRPPGRNRWRREVAADRLDSP